MSYEDIRAAERDYNAARYEFERYPERKTLPVAGIEILVAGILLAAERIVDAIERTANVAGSRR